MRHTRLIALYTAALTCTSLTLFQLFDWDRDMYHVKALLPLAWISITTAKNVTVDLTWHAPNRSWINDLSQVLNGSGTNGFIFNSSRLPDKTPYGTYNWCNMPHARTEEYPRANEDFELQYVEV